MRFQKASNFGIFGVIHFLVAFAGIGRGNDDLGGDNAKFIQIFLIFEGHRLAGSGQLGFEACALKVLSVVVADVVGDLGNALFSLIDGFGAAEFTLQIGLLLRR